MRMIFGTSTIIVEQRIIINTYWPLIFQEGS